MFWKCLVTYSDKHWSLYHWSYCVEWVWFSNKPYCSGERLDVFMSILLFFFCVCDLKFLGYYNCRVDMKEAVIWVSCGWWMLAWLASGNDKVNYCIIFRKIVNEWILVFSGTVSPRSLWVKGHWMGCYGHFCYCCCCSVFIERRS